MKNIFLLPTEKYTDLVHSTSKYGGLFLSRHYSPMKEMGDSYQYIYITSDEQIKDVRPYKGKWQLEQGEILNKFPTYLTDLSECKLVVMTTDPQLIKDGVQAIDDEFLEWFVENPTCEFVKTELLNVSEVLWEEYFKKHGVYPKYPYYEKIIIPQEESKQKFSRKWKELKDAKPSEPLKSWDDESEEEALEKAATNYSHDWENITGLDSNDVSPFGASIVDFKSGAKWQAERMYSEEEVLKIINKFNEIHYHPSEEWEITDWFEQHKKK